MAADDLRAELRADPPPGLLAALDPAELDALTKAVRDAKVRQRQALDAAADAALSHLPGLVRKALVKVLR
jgi:hypothetical protein